MTHLLERHHNDRFRAYMDEFVPQWRLHREELNRAPFVARGLGILTPATAKTGAAGDKSMSTWRKSCEWQGGDLPMALDEYIAKSTT